VPRIVILIIIYQLLPITWLVLLAKNRALINPEGAGQSELARRRTKPQLAHLRFLFADYTGPCWYWEIVDMYRRITFMSLVPFFGKGAVRAGIGTCLALLSIVLYREACPYQNGSRNVLAVAAQYQILVVFLGAIVIELSKLTDDFDFDSNNVGLGICLFCANLLVVGMAGHMGYRKFKHDSEHMEKKVILGSAQMKIVDDVMSFRGGEAASKTSNLLKEVLLDPGTSANHKILVFTFCVSFCSCFSFRFCFCLF